MAGAVLDLTVFRWDAGGVVVWAGCWILSDGSGVGLAVGGGVLDSTVFRWDGWVAVSWVGS